jgi:hypothetical protein
MRMFICLLFIVVATHKAQAEVWTAKNTWNEEWEQKYSDWVRTAVNEDFFTRGRYGNIDTDCADAVYLIRIAFSYENSLSFAMRDPSGSRNFISNSMTRWDSKKSEADRVRALMDYVSDLGSTQSLPQDTYPIAISREHLTPGSIWTRASMTANSWLGRLFYGDISGHAETVKDVRATGTVQLISSTVPRKIRELTVSSNLVYVPDNRGQGFRKFIQPQNYKLPIENQKGYSLMQYSMGKEKQQNQNGKMVETGRRSAEAFSKEVYALLALREESRDEARSRYAQDICSMSKSRIEVVLDGVRLSKSIKRCMDKDEYESYSTPSRDHRLEVALDQLLDLDEATFFRSNTKAIDRAAAFLDLCGNLNIGNGISLSLRDFLKNVNNNTISSNPNDSLEARWGLSTQKTSCAKP